MYIKKQKIKIYSFFLTYLGLELCQVQKFLPKNLDDSIAESKEILSNAPTTKSQLQNHLGLKGFNHFDLYMLLKSSEI